jgi:hypothetical protein
MRLSIWSGAHPTARACASILAKRRMQCPSRHVIVDEELAIGRGRLLCGVGLSASVATYLQLDIPACVF